MDRSLLSTNKTVKNSYFPHFFYFATLNFDIIASCQKNDKTEKRQNYKI